jgi:hypothetical protein
MDEKIIKRDNKLSKVEIELCYEDVRNLRSLYDYIYGAIKNNDAWEIELKTFEDLMAKINKVTQ